MSVASSSQISFTVCHAWGVRSHSPHSGVKGSHQAAQNELECDMEKDRKRKREEGQRKKRLNTSRSFCGFNTSTSHSHLTSSAALLQANSCTPEGTTQISCSKTSMFICSSCVCTQTRVTPSMLVLTLSLELHCHLHPCSAGGLACPRPVSVYVPSSMPTRSLRLRRRLSVYRQSLSCPHCRNWRVTQACPWSRPVTDTY